MRNALLLSCFVVCVGCGAPPMVNQNGNAGSLNSRSNANSNAVANAAAVGESVQFAEPAAYEATVKMTLEAISDQQQSRPSMPPLIARVAREGDDRLMEFTLPTNEKVQYLEKGNSKYIVLPSRKQYAELTQQALGFEVRRLMMPEQIVAQLRTIPGVTQAGEEPLNGRHVIRYTYKNTANTNTQAGTVATDSYFLIDKETGLPVRSETVSRSASGGNVQGVNGLKLLTEMTDIKAAPNADLFSLPPDFQKIDPEQVKMQVNVLFQAAAAIVGEFINQAKVSPTPVTTTTPAANR